MIWFSSTALRNYTISQLHNFCEASKHLHVQSLYRQFAVKLKRTKYSTSLHIECYNIWSFFKEPMPNIVISVQLKIII